MMKYISLFSVEDTLSSSVMSLIKKTKTNKKHSKHHRVQAPRTGERGSHGVSYHAYGVPNGVSIASLITCLAMQNSHCSRSHCNTFINNRVKKT